jgi:hypothetical protein
VVGIAIPVALAVAASVGVGVAVAVGTSVGVGVGVFVAVPVAVCVGVGVEPAGPTLTVEVAGELTWLFSSVATRVMVTTRGVLELLVLKTSARRTCW